MKEEIECKICGKKVRGKHGLSTHLLRSHRGIKLNEYEEKYGKIQTEEISNENIGVHENKMNTEESYEQNEIDKKMKISNVEWLDKKIRSGWVAVFEEDGIMQTAEPVAVGIITTETEQFPGLLIMSVDGKLLPPWLFENFRGFFTHKEIRVIEKRKKKEEKLQRRIRTVESLRGEYQELQRQEKQPANLLDKIKSSMNETEGGYKNVGKSNIFNIDMERLARQSNNILSFKRKR